MAVAYSFCKKSSVYEVSKQENEKPFTRKNNNERQYSVFTGKGTARGRIQRHFFCLVLFYLFFYAFLFFFSLLDLL